jgi:hypothetical protein
MDDQLYPSQPHTTHDEQCHIAWRLQLRSGRHGTVCEQSTARARAKRAARSVTDHTGCLHMRHTKGPLWCYVCSRPPRANRGCGRGPPGTPPGPTRPCSLRRGAAGKGALRQNPTCDGYSPRPQGQPALGANHPWRQLQLLGAVVRWAMYVL